jgi:hypothetical protein
MRSNLMLNDLRTLIDTSSYTKRAETFTRQLETTFVFRPGELSPHGTIFNDWIALYRVFSQVEGPKVIQIDDSIVSPAVIPAGVYDLFNTALVGNINKTPAGINTLCHLADGVQLARLGEVRNVLTVVSFSTSVPVRPLGDNDLLVIERGARIENDPTATVPFSTFLPDSVKRLFSRVLSAARSGQRGTLCSPLMPAPS